MKLNPVRFSIIRSIADGVTRGAGVVWEFGYSNLNQEKLDRIVKELLEIKDRFPWWESVDIMVASMLGTYA